jgi:hypothetical protein
MSGQTEGRTEKRVNPWRIARWGIATLLFLTPLVAMQFTEGWNWSPGDFVFAAVLLFGSAGAYEAAAKMTGSAAYRGAAGVAIVAGFLLVWINGAVGITDSDADVMYVLLVAPIGILGSIAARFKPRGMACAMFATAFALTCVGVGALIAGIVPAFNAPIEVLALTGFFGTLFMGSGLLFRQAGQEQPR